MVYPNITLSLLLVNLLVVTGKIVVEPLSKIEVDSPANFAEQIEVKFESNEATTNDYIGIYKYGRNNDKTKNLARNPFGEKLHFYSYFCGSQDKVSCKALEEGEGSVVFNGVDPSEAYESHWPLNPRVYKVCHMRLVDDEDTVESFVQPAKLIGECKELQVKLPTKKKKIWRRSFVKSEKEKYKYGEEIKIQFKSGIETQNSWIEIYKTNRFYDLMWLYTGCNNVLGDQDQSPYESNDCKETEKKGYVTFGPENTGDAEFSWPGKPTLDWPPPAGEYSIRLNFYYNYPKTLYKEAENTFTVEEEEE